MPSVDVESLQTASRQRSKCLDAFLLGSVFTLFVMVLSGGALALWTVKDLRAELNRAGTESGQSGQRESYTAPRNITSSYEMPNFAFLRPVSSLLKNGSMEWESMNIGKTSTVGSRYEYNPQHRTLTLLQEGTYFLYTELKLSCVGPCATGFLRVTFEDDQIERLTCSLHITHPGPSEKKCWAVIPNFPKGHRLMARMHTDVLSEGWRLDVNHSGFGMFLVDRPGTEK